jgi:hypothetical protein
MPNVRPSVTDYVSSFRQVPSLACHVVPLASYNRESHHHLNVCTHACHQPCFCFSWSYHLYMMKHEFHERQEHKTNSLDISHKMVANTSHHLSMCLLTKTYTCVETRIQAFLNGSYNHCLSGNITDGIIANSKLREIDPEFRITPVNAATQEKVQTCIVAQPACCA